MKVQLHFGKTPICLVEVCADLQQLEPSLSKGGLHKTVVCIDYQNQLYIALMQLPLVFNEFYEVLSETHLIMSSQIPAHSMNC